ncbi:hypothetical protein F9L04_26365, partial [Brucella anthropi]
YAELGRGSAVARLKDIATIQGVRENQLVGYGLVIGLKGTGDSTYWVAAGALMKNCFSSNAVSLTIWPG